MFAKLLSILRQQALGAVALFIVLGGTSFAVATGSIDSREIKNNTIRGKDVRNGTLTTNDLKNGSLLAGDFKLGQLPAGPRGAKGDTGATGATGVQGPPGISGLEVVAATRGPNSESPKELMANCPAGKRVIGTGYDISGATTGDPPNMLSDVVLDQLQPSDQATVPGWVAASALEEEPTAANWSLAVSAICANVR